MSDIAALDRTDDVYADLPYVEGGLNYLTPMAEKPYVLAYRQREDGELPTNAVYEERKVRIHDARPIASKLTLDREGVAFVPHTSAVTDFRDPEQLSGVCEPEAAELVRQVTGAKRVIAFDYTIRRRTDGVPDRSVGIPRLPVMRVHNDYTETSGPQRVRDLMGDEAEELLKGRYAFINVWRPTMQPVLDSPLALCDAQSVPAEDFVASDLIYQDRKGEITVATWSPEHRWLYFPKMTMDETVLIKCFDSRRDVARFTAHSAFIDPTTPADAPVRESVEVRTIAFF